MAYAILPSPNVWDSFIMDKNLLYVVYNEYKSGGSVCAGQKDDEWPNYEDENISFNIDSVHHRQGADEKNLPWLRERLELDFDPAKLSSVWIVVVRYGTGGTFGHTNGAWRIMGAFETVDEAQELSNQITGGTYDGYKFWEGYFECLEGVEVNGFPVHQ